MPNKPCRTICWTPMDEDGIALDYPDLFRRVPVDV
jgi:hypothetical protein